MEQLIMKFTMSTAIPYLYIIYHEAREVEEL